MDEARGLRLSSFRTGWLNRLSGLWGVGADLNVGTWPWVAEGRGRGSLCERFTKKVSWEGVGFGRVDVHLKGDLGVSLRMR